MFFISLKTLPGFLLSNDETNSGHQKGNGIDTGIKFEIFTFTLKEKPHC